MWVSGVLDLAEMNKQKGACSQPASLKDYRHHKRLAMPANSQDKKRA
jgi:hypothetical protein